MIQIRASKNTPNGVCSILMRFIDKNIFIKKKQNSPESMNLINQYREKGVKVIERREWIKLDIFGDNELVKLGDKEIDLSKMNEDEKERAISDFYIETYKKGGFIVETHGITT